MVGTMKMLGWDENIFKLPFLRHFHATAQSLLAVMS
jgi:hypothetical protein